MGSQSPVSENWDWMCTVWMEKLVRVNCTFDIIILTSYQSDFWWFDGEKISYFHSWLKTLWLSFKTEHFLTTRCKNWIPISKEGLMAPQRTVLTRRGSVFLLKPNAQCGQQRPHKSAPKPLHSPYPLQHEWKLPRLPGSFHSNHEPTISWPA